MTEACPCGRRDARGRPLSLDRCCGSYLHNSQPAPDAECLMRSRYSAFVLGDVDHLLRTWHTSTRPATLELESGIRWLGLEVRAFTPLDETHAEVEFVVRARLQGRGQRLHERSRFVYEDGQWFYVDGDLL